MYDCYGTGGVRHQTVRNRSLGRVTTFEDEISIGVSIMVGVHCAPLLGVLGF